jgi:MFS family permease
MSATLSAADQTPLLSYRSYIFYWLARVATNGASQMLLVAVGWQIYNLTNNPLDLGYVGLIQFVATISLTLVVGTVADRYDRRTVVRTCQIGKALATAVLAAASFGGFVSRELFFLVIFVFGACRAFETPTMHALVPGIVPPTILSRAIAASNSASQVAIIVGPAVGGFLYLLGPGNVYLTCTAVFVIASIFISLIRLERPTGQPKKVSLQTVFAGFHYIRNQPVVFGVILLDLFAVLLGGVTALLPIYARDILHTGPEGLGILRAAPAVGAIFISIGLAHSALTKHVGMILLTVVTCFGLSIIVFGLSTSLYLSIAALAVYGAMDACSVVIRHSLVQTRTPHDMLGRVMAVNSLFTSTSGTLGDFESGVVAAFFGPVVAALVGGVGAIAIAVTWGVMFPALRRVQNVMPESDEYT